MNLDTFRIEDIVIHDVPLPREDAAVILTDAPIDFGGDADLPRYFRDKIVASLKKRGLDVLADADASPVTRESVAAILSDETELVAQSQALARHLFSIQNNSNSAGLLAVITGTADDAAVVSVLKLEREEGLRLQIIQDANDRMIADVEHLRNLTLTDKTKVFKTSILSLDDPEDELSLAGRVSDDQRALRAGEGVATFFLSRFLGCRLRTSPEVATRDFVSAVETFINGVEDQERKAEYHIALLATLQDQQMDISPAGFAASHLLAEHQPAYVEALEGVGLDPTVTFQKDIKLARAKGFKWYFAHGMTLIGSREDAEQGRVIVPSSPNEPTQIFDTLKRLQGL
jgi:hypothetical protein